MSNVTPVDLLVACVTVPAEPVVYPNLPVAEIKISLVEVILVAVAVPNEGVVKTGLPVQLLKSPLEGKPNVGVIKIALVNVGAVNINESVICRVTSPCATGNTSVVAAVVAMGSSVIAISAILYP